MVDEQEIVAAMRLIMERMKVRAGAEAIPPVCARVFKRRRGRRRAKL